MRGSLGAAEPPQLVLDLLYGSLALGVPGADMQA
jgi:hypothetical protein